MNYNNPVCDKNSRACVRYSKHQRLVPVTWCFTTGLVAGRGLDEVFIPANIGLAGFGSPPVISYRMFQFSNQKHMAMFENNLYDTFTEEFFK